jgi:hypothetical protein
MRTLGHEIVALTLVVAVAACARDDAEPEGENTMAADSPAAHSGAAHGATGATQLSAADSQVVNDVRRTADQYRDLAAARTAGYSKQYPEGCVQTADGSQGFHFIKESLVDDRVELTTPELVMYEPKADGSMELIGVDYVIPFDRWTAAEPPQILGRPMMRNEPLGVWALHIWTHRDNPSGMFAAYNPAVSCDHAAAARM